MNATSASPAEAGLPRHDTAGPARRVLVWDAPVRVFHWLAVLSFAGAWLTAESERWRLAHVTLGYTLAALVAFRLVWGLVGTRHARFADFVRGPRAVWRYLRNLVAGTPEHHVGHNPAGAWAIVGLLGGALLLTASGWAAYEGLGGEWLEELHEGAANAMLALVAVHVAGVVVSGWLHHENLVAGMITGRKRGEPADGVRRAWHGLALLMLVAVLGFWAQAWLAPPAARDVDAARATAPLDRAQPAGTQRRRADDDD